MLVLVGRFTHERGTNGLYTRQMLSLALTVALVGALLAGAGMAAEPPWIFAVHDANGYSKIEQAGKRGWLVVTVEIGHNPYDYTGGDFRFYSNRGHGVIVRLNNGYGSNGTLPYQSQYQNFATRCANYVAATQGADIFIIGNETNLPREWPGNVGGSETTGEPITVARYVDCYNRCYNAIKAVRSTALVCPTPSGTWAPPYPGQGIEGFLDYWVNILNSIGASKIDCLALHAYTHGCDPALVTSTAKMGPPYTNIYYNFRVYQNYMAAIPTSMRTKPVYITECDQNIECADPPPIPRNTWYNVNNNWCEAIYSEINTWNSYVSNQKIRCVALFRWDSYDEGDWSFTFSTRTNVVQDWLEAMANDYRWDAGTKGIISGTVKDSNNTAIVGATVSTNTGGYTATTGTDGAYTITSVNPGTYNVTASKSGYYSQTINSRTVTAGQTTTVNFTLAEIPPVSITSVSAAAISVDRGQTGVPISMTVRNDGTDDLRIDQAYPTFWQGTTDVSAYYTVTPDTSNGAIVARNGGTLALNFTVNVASDAPYGPTTIDGYVRVWPNAVPNGSFEEGGSVIPPTHWINWNNNPGVSWTYDTTSKSLGSRSYVLGLSSAASGTYCTSNTGSGNDLLTVKPSTQYYNSLYRRTSVSSGSATFMLVFEEYDSSKTIIGGSKYHYPGASATWQQSGVNYTTSATAAYARTWVGIYANGSTTTGSMWVDDVQLRQTSFYYTDSSAATTDLWTVGTAVPTIGAAKQRADSGVIILSDKVITAKFTDCFYIEESNRSSGIRVEGTTTAAVGDRVDVGGTLGTTNGERRLSSASVAYKSTGSRIGPVGVVGDSLGGVALNAYTPGVYQGRGLNNVGLFVRVWGRVTYADSSVFYLDDGSVCDDGSGHEGFRINISSPAAGESIAPPPVGQFVCVTGISTTAVVGLNNVRCVRVAKQSDIALDVIPDGAAFYDDFESGLAAWNAAASSTMMYSSTERSMSPTRSAKGLAGEMNAMTTVLPGAYSTCVGQCWIYDAGGAGSAGRHYMQLRSYTGTTLDDFFMLGMYSTVSTQYYCVRTYAGGWVATSVPRSIGWHKFAIHVRPYTAAVGDVVCYIDGKAAYKGQRKGSYPVNEFWLGCNGYTGLADGFYDEAVLREL